MHPLFCLKGQVAFITGAGSEQGIGFAAAKILAELGAQVAITATTPRIHERANTLRAISPKVQSYICDLTDRKACKALIENVEANFGKIDVLVNKEKDNYFASFSQVEKPVSSSLIGRQICKRIEGLVYDCGNFIARRGSKVRYSRCSEHDVDIFLNVYISDTYPN